MERILNDHRSFFFNSEKLSCLVVDLRIWLAVDKVLAGQDEAEIWKQLFAFQDLMQILIARGRGNTDRKSFLMTAFYEFLCTLTIFFILLFVRSKSKRPWTVTSLYCILYGIARFFIEGLRTDSLYIAHTELRTSQVLSLVLVVLGLVLISLAHIYEWEKKPIPERFFKADEAMAREAQRRKEEKLRAYEEEEDVEDRVERLAKSTFTSEDEYEDEDESSSENAPKEDSEGDESDEDADDDASDKKD